MDEELEAAKERSWREVAAGAELVVPAYLAAKSVQGGSGHSGTAEDWEYSRGIVAEAVDRSGTFLDVGCANGLLMKSVARWGLDKGRSVEPFGLDISAELAALARSRLPVWANRIFVGNALGWVPPFRFGVVRTAIDYVPPPRRRPLSERALLRHPRPARKP